MVHLQHIASTFASIVGKTNATDLVTRVARAAQPLDYQTILDSIGDDVQCVLIGEASHGTHDFYHHRAEITKLLMQEKGFNMVGIEADFPDTHRVNQFVTNNKTKDKNATQALGDYARFPTFMWRNTIFQGFVDWLRKFNDAKTSNDEKSEIFGMDVYSLESSRDAVLAFLDKYDPELPGVAVMAREAYSIVRKYGNSRSAERVLKALETYLAKFPHFEELFTAVQNARCVKGCSDYYAENCSWNTRDGFMFETVKQQMMRREQAHGDIPKVVIWAHNSHLGNSLYTGMNHDGEINVGRLLKEHFGPERAMCIGFTTFDGSVTASHEWDEPCDFKLVNQGIANSTEELFHKAALVDPARFEKNNLLMVFRSTGSKDAQADDELVKDLGTRSLEQRFIGVIYRPKTEKRSHYQDVRVAKQFDMVIHVDRSSALVPLDIPSQWASSKKLLRKI
jgi:erythromycin esterase-like protein